MLDYPYAKENPDEPPGGFINDTTSRAVRGGGFPDKPEYLRSAYRGKASAARRIRMTDVGVRVVRTLK